MTGLIGWWPLHENSGSTARDLSGNGNHGTLNGNVTTGVAGKGGLTAYSFDGNDDYVDVGSDIPQFSAYTISAWVKMNDLTSVQSIYRARANNDFNLGVEKDGELNLMHSDGNTEYVVGNSAESEKWYHIVGAWNGEHIHFYINGEIKDSKSVDSIGSESGNDNIGRHSGGKEHLDGIISDVRIYNRALSPEEIQTLYEWGSGDYTRRSLHDGTDSGAVSRYEFESSSVAADSWGSNTLTDNTSAGTTTDAIHGDAKNFDGTDDNMPVGDVSVFEGLSALTLTGWSNLNDTSGTYGIAGKEFVSRIQHNSGDWQYLISTDGSNWTTNIKYGGNVYSGEWVFMALTYNDPNVKCYLNGHLVATGSDSGGTGTNSNDFVIGAYDNNGYTGYMNGQIDDVRFYNRALSPSEVFQLYQWGTRGRDMRKLTTNARGGT